MLDVVVTALVSPAWCSVPAVVKEERWKSIVPVIVDYAVKQSSFWILGQERLMKLAKKENKEYSEKEPEPVAWYRK